VNSPNPALVSQRAVQRLPRLALWLLGAAYLLPGLFGRDPWKTADISAFGLMASIAQERTSWFAPSVGGLPPDTALLPYWLGAAFIKLLDPWVDPALAARIPFMLLLGLALALTWLTTYHLARTEAAQPLAFAFGGEAHPVDYARAIADGSLLALIATLGLLQLGHETTPELVQLTAVALYLYALAASPFRTLTPRVAMPVALVTLAASGAPAMAVLLGGIGTAISFQSSYSSARSLIVWVLLGVGLALGVADQLGAWAWRVRGYDSLAQVLALVRLFAWFTWPAWPLALWTLWQWRRRLLNRHMAVPLGCLLACASASIAMGGSDRALLLGLPSLAVLAAFALPTLQRRASAAIDWFSVFFFTVGALVIWVMYVSMHLGVPAKPAANLARLVPGFTPSFSALALALAITATLAWLWLVRWRSGRSRHPLWKSLVLPAGGVALCWLLLMTLMLPPLNHARSFRSQVMKIARHVPAQACVATPGMPRGQIAALEYHAGLRVEASASRDSSCEFLFHIETRDRMTPSGQGWQLLARERRNNDAEVIAVYRRAPAN
jgi:4-amino-4-deoxy-L-arabinose transferase-like glycosyltransferase